LNTADSNETLTSPCRVLIASRKHSRNPKRAGTYRPPNSPAKLAPCRRTIACP
jgi:hypothetical protein